MKKIIVMVAAVLVCWLTQTAVFAAEVETLVNKLVEKKVITPVEGQIILEDTKTNVAKQTAQGTADTLPAWVQSIKWKGDLRMRYQWEEKDKTPAGGDTTTTRRERARLRLRLGGEANVAPDWKAYWRIDSAGSPALDDPRSTNATFEKTSSAKAISIGQAYMTYKPVPEAALVLGKMDRGLAIWTPDDLLWDGDINPEGAALSLNTNIADGLSGWINASYLIMAEVGGGADPSIVCIQPGVDWDIMDNLAFKGSLNYYAANSIKGLAAASIVGSGGTNTYTSDGDYKYDYDCWGFSAQLGMNLQKDAEVRQLINYAGVFADYIQNPDPDQENTGYLVGTFFGDKSVKDKNQWKATLLYRSLGKDAWPDFLDDSDFLSGITDAKGYELILEYGLAKNVTFGLDYYASETIKAATKLEQSLLQADIVMKF